MAGASRSSNFFYLLALSFFAFSIPVITLMVHANPSGASPGTPFTSWRQVFFVSGGSLVLLWGICFSLLKIDKKRIFLPLFIASFLLTAACSITLSLLVHRDYFSSLFQLLLIYWLLFAFKNSLFTSLHSNKQFYTYLFIINTVIFGLAMVWIVFMGYAIATRQEPRWAESIVYNAYNLVLIFILGAVSLRLQLRRFRIITVSGDEFYIDNWNFSSYFSEIDKKMVLLFLHSPKKTTCAVIDEHIRDGEPEGRGKESKWECNDCLEQDFTATRCPKYKNIYNRILNIKKLFESLEIGTLISPQNKRQIKTEGWKLRLFDDVRVIAK